MVWTIPDRQVLEEKTTEISFPTQILIDGQFRDALSGQTFETLNPATGKKLADVAAAGKEDIDLTVSAARKAFENGPWARMSGRERGRILYKVAQLIRERQGELAILESMDNGKPISEAQFAPLTAAEVFEYYAGWADKYHGEVVPLKTNNLNYILHEPM